MHSFDAHISTAFVFADRVTLHDHEHLPPEPPGLVSAAQWFSQHPRKEGRFVG